LAAAAGSGRSAAAAAARSVPAAVDRKSFRVADSSVEEEAAMDPDGAQGKKAKKTRSIERV